MHLLQALPLATTLLLSLTTASPLAKPNPNTNALIFHRNVAAAPALKVAAPLPAAATHELAKSKRQNTPMEAQDLPYVNSPIFNDMGDDGSGGVDESAGSKRLGRRRAQNDNDDSFASTSGSSGDGSEKVKRDPLCDEVCEEAESGFSADGGWQETKRGQ